MKWSATMGSMHMLKLHYISNSSSFKEWLVYTRSMEKQLLHRQLMITIGQRLNRDDLEDLKYLCADILTETALGGVRTPTDLFARLQHHGHLSPGHYEFAKWSLISIGRSDLASVLPTELDSSNVRSSCVPAVAVPENKLQLQHRMMLVSVASKLGGEDVTKLAYICEGKVQASTTALEVFAKLEDSHLVSCGDYSFLCDMLRVIGRYDLAGFISGLPGDLPTGFSMRGQALQLMLERLKQRKSVYVLHRKKISAIKDGSSYLVCNIHSKMAAHCVTGLSADNSMQSNPSSEVLRKAFDSQFRFLRCVVSTNSELKQLRFKDSFSFSDCGFGCESGGEFEYPCLVAESAHQVRSFIFDSSCEVLGKAEVTEVNRLNVNFERAISICSGYSEQILSLMSSLISLLTAISQGQTVVEQYEWLVEILTVNKEYLLASFPLLVPFVQRKYFNTLSRFFQVDVCDYEDNEIEFDGVVNIIVVPSYALLLNLWLSVNGCVVNVQELREKLVRYVQLHSHITGSAGYLKKLAVTFFDDILCFSERIVKLDDLCAPLIEQLISY